MPVLLSDDMKMKRREMLGASFAVRGHENEEERNASKKGDNSVNKGVNTMTEVGPQVLEIR